MGKRKNAKVKQPVSQDNSNEDGELIFEESGFQLEDSGAPGFFIDDFDEAPIDQDYDEPILKKLKVEEIVSQTHAAKDDKAFLKFLKQMKLDLKKKAVDNDYSKILKFLNEYNTDEKKHNYIIANKHARSLNLQNCKDVVKETCNDFDVVQENLQRAKTEEEESERHVFQRPQPFNPNLKFEDMHFSESMHKALEEMEIKSPTDIQKAVIPEAFAGKDVVACASTGSGKTLAFLLPTVRRLVHRPNEDKKTRVLIITPSRELALQIFGVGTELCKYTDISFSTAVGGVKAKKQREELKKKPDIVIATPGRLICHMVGTMNFSFEDVEIIIIDEADQMLNPDFTKQLKPVLQRCSKTRQTLLFSATMTETVKDLSVACLKNPVRIFVNKTQELSSNLHQEIILLKKGKDIARIPTLIHLVLKYYKKKVIIFAQMKIQCTYAFILLSLLGLKCAELHSDKDQDDRTLALERFKNEEIDILICTEVAARGLDIEGVNTIINLNPPATYQQYVHRVGRTARAGMSGKAVTIINENAKPEMQILDNVKKFSKGPLARRYLVDGYMKDVTNIINKLTPMVEEIHNTITDAKAKKAELSLLDRPAGQVDKPKKTQKSSELSFDDAMAEPKQKPDRSLTKFEMKVKRGLMKKQKKL